MLGSDILVKMLIGYGVDTMFGVPGDTNVPLYTSLQRHAGTANSLSPVTVSGITTAIDTTNGFRLCTVLTRR